MRLTRRRLALGTTLAIAVAGQFIIFGAQPAFAATAGTWAALKNDFSTTISGTIMLTGPITGVPGEQLSLAAGADITLDLGGYTLDVDASSTPGAAGIHVTTGESLTITDTSAGHTGRLTARGGLTTVNNGGAGIGGNGSQPGGDVTIKAGTVNAYGGFQAAGIGGANAPGGDVTITGGVVNATGGTSGAGIGGGWASSGGGTISITGGIVTATGGANFGAGIGAGKGGSGSAVSIRGGTVTAVSGQAAPIGGSDHGSPGTLDVYAAPFGPTGAGGTGATAPAITAHPTNGLRYSVTDTATTFKLQFGQVLSFDSAGGTSVPAEFVAQGSTPTTPAVAPTRADHVFLGWYTTATATTPFDFTAPLTADATAYAQWADAKNTVSFDLNGHGAVIASQVIAYGKKATAPVAPTASGYTFTGWYTDKAAATRFDFTTPITGPITLYAGWKAVATASPSSTAPSPTASHPSPSASTAPLAETGADSRYLVGLAALLLLGGGVALVAARRRCSHG